MVVAVGNLIRKSRFLKKCRYLVAPISLVLILLICFSMPVVAGETKSPVEEIQGKPVDLKGLTISDIEKLFPMTPEAEAAIVHQAPLCPVIIDGVRYEGYQISLFNGKRLRFIDGNDGALYAFTTLEGFERFQAQIDFIKLRQDVEISTFYLGTFYSGSSMGIPTGDLRWSLDSTFDNAISSLKVSVDASWAYLFDYPGLTGDWYGFPQGSSYPMLQNQGWDNRASSIWVAE
jgi:hypothetical protein